MIKILHTGDIHLDAPFSRLDAAKAEVRRSELRAAFTSMMTYARTNAVDLILMSGDIFESEFVTRETIALIRREFERVSAKIVIAPGNHDCASEKSIWRAAGVFPSNVYIFKDDAPSKFSFDELGVDVYGYAFTSQELYSWPLDGYKVENPERINLVCAHALVTSQPSSYAPVTEEQIERFGADYVALGHVHNPNEPMCRAGRSYYSYCGCLEGRAFDELGPKGAVVVEMDKTDGILTFVPHRMRFSKKVYECEDISVDGSTTLSDITAAIERRISERKYCDDVILQARITGAVSPSLIVNKKLITDSVQSVAYIDLIDETTPTFDTEALANDLTVRGEYYRLLLPKLNSADRAERECASAALRIGLAALSGESIAY